MLKWTPNTLMSGCDEKEKSLFWDHALTVNLSDVVYLHCHQQGKDARHVRWPYLDFTFQKRAQCIYLADCLTKQNCHEGKNSLKKLLSELTENLNTVVVSKRLGRRKR